MTKIVPTPPYLERLKCRVKERTGPEVVDALIQRGILIQGYSSPTMSHYIRIAVGRSEQNGAVMVALRKLEEME